MAETNVTRIGTCEIRSEAHTLHWVAWVARPSDGKPERSLLHIGQTREEAEEHARLWAERHQS